MIDHKHEFPPNIDAIDAAFHVKEKPVIYAYGGVIYNPHRVFLHHFLIEHEKVHLARQGDDPAGWWDRYIKDDVFRYIEELFAHRRELAVRQRGKDGKKYTSYALLKETARRLSAPFYGYKRVTLKIAECDLLSVHPCISEADRTEDILKWEGR
jgi:hypothetical protein